MDNFEPPQNVDQDLAHAFNGYHSVSQIPNAEPQRSQTDGVDLTQSHRIDLPHESLNASINQTNSEQVPKRVNQKYGAKKKSWVWNWFVQDETDNDLVICEECGKVIKRLVSDKGSPKKLSEHLKTHRFDKHSVNSRRNTVSAFNSPQPSILTNGSVRPPPQLPPAVLAEFDTSPYTQMKFHKDVMRFLTENKLPISIVRSPSFRQIVFSLRPEAIDDLNDLDSIYSSFIEVLRNNNRPDGETQKYPDPAAANGVSWI